ncbi:polysaccharide pyruvyl transferase family protein [Streptomyces buecherae]|uniref:polysaccharide pyruvyl transferase family protein n=1 Tax=Streptomyces buecherae TaxID=2763006 RepID=UPI00340F89A7
MPRTLLTGWFSFLHGEVTAGDLLVADVVRDALRGASIPYDTAWSPTFRPAGLHLENVDPAAYTHLVFACGPLHSGRPAVDGVPAPLLELHRRFTDCRRIAVGVSVVDPADPAVTGFDVVLARDEAAAATGAPDLSRHAPPPRAVPVVGVVVTEGQHEYGARRRHGEVARAIEAWAGGLDAARLPLDTRLDAQDWRLPASPDQVHAVFARLDAVVTTRLHGLVLGLRAGTPVVAVDPVAGGAKVSAQAAALGWPMVLPAERVTAAELDQALDWCLSPAGRARARELARSAGAPTGPDLLADLLRHLAPGAG